ncbi:MAG TPA: PilZ domain-containing protein [Candidatus Dormibacteraeota bacterium]|nr:PilZ domain-containing protein [Candidatus Dormibacteraeota bacterium]
MAPNSRLSGREEKRLPVMMEAKLASTESGTAERQESVHVENISAHGARLYAPGPWRLGEQVEITPVAWEQPLRGDVIYCQKLADERFVVGLEFRSGPLLRSMLQKLKGKDLMIPRDWQLTNLFRCSKCGKGYAVAGWKHDPKCRQCGEPLRPEDAEEGQPGQGHTRSN